MAGEPSVGWFPISAKVHFIEQVERDGGGKKEIEHRLCKTT
ncbi:hypothetical protein Xekk_04373 [Xenorhabdus sp. KK7.4]|nr:hypothetical protein Xekk_04373 [Xenorhabdus sp. KK7.4]